MPITYDLKTDIRYLQGVEAAKMDLIKDFIKGGEFANDVIAKYFKISIKEVERIKNDLANPPEEEQSEGESHSPDNQDTNNTD